MPERADARYAVEVHPPPRWLVPLLELAAVAIAAVTQTVALTYGRRRVIVTDLVSGEVVGDLREALLVDERSVVGRMLAEHATMSTEEFARSWLDSADNRRGESAPSS